MELKEAVLNIVGKRTADNPITQVDLVRTLYRLGYDTTERYVRDLISQLRKEGELILSVSKKDGGYYMSRSMDDYQEFRRIKFWAQIDDMLETMRAMDKSATESYKTGLQERLL
jgi:hypothetical protein